MCCAPQAGTAPSLPLSPVNENIVLTCKASHFWEPGRGAMMQRALVAHSQKLEDDF